MLGLTKPSPMSSTPPPAGSTGTTTAGSTAPSEWSRPPNTSKPTTLPSTRRSSPHENGTKAVTLQSGAVPPNPKEMAGRPACCDHDPGVAGPAEPVRHLLQHHPAAPGTRPAHPGSGLRVTA